MRRESERGGEIYGTLSANLGARIELPFQAAFFLHEYEIALLKRQREREREALSTEQRSLGVARSRTVNSNYVSSERVFPTEQ